MARAKKVLAGGVFNILHPGHVHFLIKARKLGDELVVVVAHDETVRKRGKKLLFPAADRARLVEALSCVDRAVVGDPGDMSKVVSGEKPDVIAIGYDQDEGEAIMACRNAGLSCRIARIGELKGYSTRGITGE